MKEIKSETHEAHLVAWGLKASGEGAKGYVPVPS